jgi:Common central domain of tyrosinase/Polyphenol oxidase middle domain
MEVRMRSLSLLLIGLLLTVGAVSPAASSPASPEYVPGYPLYCQGPLVTNAPSGRETTTFFVWASTGAGAAPPRPGECSWADRTGQGPEIQSDGGNVICDFSGAMRSVLFGKFIEIGVARDPIAGNCMHLVRYIGSVSPPFPAKPALPPFVRQSIAVLTPSQIASLRHGLQVMMSRPATDPTSYRFQANIHGTYDFKFTGEQFDSWDQCEHGSYYFFSWHRMYLYFFDRILRAASGDPKLVLPYWNWTDPAQRTLPLAFRVPADAGNPLYLAPPGRPAMLDLGTAQLSEGAVFDGFTFGDVPFDSPAGSTGGFGGQIAPPMFFNSPHGDFESQPHDAVHSELGGLMADPLTAAQDPVFWLHHANVDRIWNTWIAQGGGRHNPTDAAWLNTRFTFYNEASEPVYLTGAEIVDTVGQLNYQYDDHPTILQVFYPPAGLTRFLAEDRQFAVAGKQAMPRDEVPAPVRVREELATSGAPRADLQRIELGGTSARVAVPLTDAATARMRTLVATHAPRQVYLRFDDIRIAQMSGVYYEVYLNPPAGTKLGSDTPGYVGTLSPFGLKPHAMAGRPAPVQNVYAEYDISRLVGEAVARDPKGLAVVLVPRGLFDLRGEPLPVPATVQGTLGTVRIIGG